MEGRLPEIPGAAHVSMAFSYDYSMSRFFLSLSRAFYGTYFYSFGEHDNTAEALREIASKVLSW